MLDQSKTWVPELYKIHGQFFFTVLREYDSSYCFAGALVEQNHIVSGLKGFLPA